jgi:hypothetical protein
MEGMRKITENPIPVVGFRVIFAPQLSIIWPSCDIYEDVSKSFRTGRLERELQMVQLSATTCSCIAIL